MADVCGDEDLSGRRGEELESATPSQSTYSVPKFGSKATYPSKLFLDTVNLFDKPCPPSTDANQAPDIYDPSLSAFFQPADALDSTTFAPPEPNNQSLEEAKQSRSDQTSEESGSVSSVSSFAR